MTDLRQFSYIPIRALRDAELTEGDKVVLAGLGAFTNEHGICWPTVETLSAMVNLSDRGVRQSMARLIQHGYVERSLQGFKGRSNVYRVVYDSPKAEHLFRPQGGNTRSALHTGSGVGGTPVPTRAEHPFPQNETGTSSGTTSSKNRELVLREIPSEYHEAVDYYAKDHHAPDSYYGAVWTLLDKQRSPHYPAAVVGLSLLEMQSDSEVRRKGFRLTSLARWCGNKMHDTVGAGNRPSVAPSSSPKPPVAPLVQANLDPSAASRRPRV